MARRVALLSVITFVLTAPHGAAGDSAQREACIPGEGSRCAGGGVQSENLLIQFNSELEKARVGLTQRATASVAIASSSDGARIAAHIREFLSDALNAANAIKVGFTAVKGAVPLFSEGKISEGLTALAGGLFEALVLVLPADTRESAAFQEFKQSVAHVAKTAPGVVRSVREGVKLYNEEGNVAALVQACNAVIENFGPLAMQCMPTEVVVEVGKYMGAVEDALAGFGEAIDSYSTGNTTDAMGHLYRGLRTAIGELVPEEWTQNEDFTEVIEVLDATVADLGSIVLRFQQKVVESGACWKVIQDRERARANQCPDEHWFDGLHWCFAKGTSAPLQIKSGSDVCLDVGTFRSGVRTEACNRADLKQQWFFDESTGQLKEAKGRCLLVSRGRARLRSCSQGQEWTYTNASGLLAQGEQCLSESMAMVACDASDVGKWTMSTAQDVSLLDASTSRKRESTTKRATCDKQSEFSEQHGSWCYGSCPEGFATSGTRCSTECAGEYPAKAPLMCGKSYKMLGLAVTTMAASTWKTGLTAKEVSSSIGVGGALNFTINSFVELGVGFVNPTCP